MRKKLKKELGLSAVFCIASGAMISSGLFVLPAVAFSNAGPAVILSYLLAGIFVIPALLSKAELATAMPRAGGTYFYIERTLGPVTGVFSGLANWFSLALKSAFALIGMGIFVGLLFPGITELQIKIIAVGFCIFFMLLNIISVKGTGKFQMILVFVLFALLGLYCLRSFNYIEPNKYVPFMPYGIGSVFATAGIVYISFGGLTKVASIAEEVKDPNRNIPLGMILAFCVVLIMYLLVIFATVGILDGNVLRNSLTPISTGAKVSMGSFGVFIMVIAALIAFITTANAGILTASRFPMAMARDQLLPSVFQKISFRYKTPYVAIIITGVFMVFSILFFSLENLVKTASTMMIILFMFVNAAVIIMRESRIQSYRPTFKTPLYPWIQILGIVIPGFFIFEMGKVALSITGAFIAVSLIWYLIFVRTKVKRQSAFVHIIERFTAKELGGATLGDELKEILIERDNIVEDRFDHLIKDCEILDIDHSVSLESAFKMISSELSKRLSISEEGIYNKLIDREKQSSTVISKGLAIPHIIIEGEKKFDIFLVRCKEGIVLSGSSDRVHTMFVLIGSMDERNFHLRALAAIAQIAQDRDFDKSWLKARNIEELRDIILLAERKRIGII